jgi:mono/diheme cytochrome c family protein
VAIRPADEQDYMLAVSGKADAPRTAFLRAKANQTGQSYAEAEAADLALSTTSNPFNARRDPDAVSRGAVIYKHNCMRCHGANADGYGPDVSAPTSDMGFRQFSTRFAVTLHGGAPSKWFRIISDGVMSSEAVDAGGLPLVMAPFRETLAREQIWLTVTYLQSLD